MGRTQYVYKGAIDNLTIYTHTTRIQEVARHRRVLHQACLIKNSSNRHILSSSQFDLWQIIRQFAFLHTVTRSTVSIGRRLFSMETRNDLFSQLDLDVPWIGTRLDIRTECIDLIHGKEAEQLKVAPHQRIRNGNQLAVHDARRFLDADVVAQGLGHLLHAVQTFEQRHGQNALRLLTITTLQLTPHQQVEFLVGPAQLDIRAQRHRVIPLNQRIEKLVNGDWLIGGIALVEVVALEHPRNGVLRGQANEVRRPHLIHPGGVECHFGLGRIQDLEDLGLVGLGIIEHLLAGQRRTRCALAARVADHPGEVPYKEDHLMTQLLELTQLINKHGVAQVQIRRSRIKARLNTQRLAALELLDQLGLDQQFFRTTFDQR